METFQWYKGYGILYMQIGGNTIVKDGWQKIKMFSRMGEINGEKKAKKYIDELIGDSDD